MKKVIGILLSTALMLSLVTTVAFGETISIGHSVDVLDSFSVKSKNITKFTGTTAIEIAEVNVINNTRDGYKVMLSAAHGALHSVTADNGESNIPYTLSKSQSGSHPSGTISGFKALSVPSTPPTTPEIILGNENALSGELLNDPTDLEFTIKVAVTDASFLEMAGTYTDTISITYQDL